MILWVQFQIPTIKQVLPQSESHDFFPPVHTSYVYPALLVKNLPANSGDLREMESIPGSDGSPREKNGNLLQYSCLGNSMDMGARWATDYGVTKSWT